jgi:hypothetical protein
MPRFICILEIYLASGGTAFACATCGLGRDDAASPYFLAMIVFMTAVPVILAGAAIRYLRKGGKPDDLDERPEEHPHQ